MNILFSDKSVTKLSSIINKELCSLEEWLLANRLTVNITKTNFMCCTKTQKKAQQGLFSCISINLFQKKLSYVSQIKYFGMFIDDHRKWKYHVRYISNKILKSIGIIYDARKCLDVGILKQL